MLKKEKKEDELMNLLFGNPKLGLIILIIAILGVFSTMFFMLYSLNKSKFKELIKWFFNLK
ncbi:hypothetical protein HMPREF3222_01727 [Clostridium perfringens]|uniref:Uncharacterized protein n=1 Tax=Clostridium perfringens TaxID=1502 RepID=A0A133N5A6_CLOPF|nr:hypothetical protein HMPREF3222_01727 [Clostridium perfringens]